LGEEAGGHSVGYPHAEHRLPEAVRDVVLVAPPRGGRHPELPGLGQRVEKFLVGPVAPT
jgi:hypothetical protein